MVLGAPRRARLDDAARAPRAPRGRPRPTPRCRGASPSPRPASRRAAAARYTWPIDAAASGCQSKRGEHVARAARRAPPRATRRRRHAARGRTWSWSSESSLIASGDSRSVRVESDLAELHEHPAALLERRAAGAAPSASARRSRRRRRCATEAERRTEPVAHRDAGDLGVPRAPAGPGGAATAPGAGPTASPVCARAIIPGRARNSIHTAAAIAPNSANRNRLRAKPSDALPRSFAISSDTATPTTNPTMPGERRSRRTTAARPSTRPTRTPASTENTNAGIEQPEVAAEPIEDRLGERRRSSRPRRRAVHASSSTTSSPSA